VISKYIKLENYFNISNRHARATQYPTSRFLVRDFRFSPARTKGKTDIFMLVFIAE